MTSKTRSARLAHVFTRDGGRCYYCGIRCRLLKLKQGPFPRDMATQDRLEPGTSGGTYHRSNVVLACWGCNNERGATPAVEFYKRKRPTESLAHGKSKSEQGGAPG